MEPRELKFRKLFSQRRPSVDLDDFLSVYTTVASIVNSINSLNLMSGVATVMNNNFSSNDAASVLDDSNMTTAKATTIINNSNLTPEKVIDIFDNVNMSMAKLKAIFESGSLSEAEKRAATLEGARYVAADAATSVNGAYYTVAELASAFDNEYLTSVKAGSIFNSTNVIESRINAILVHANITDSKAQEILNETTYATRDLIGLPAVLYTLYDDWADNELSSRDTRAVTAAEVLGANEFAQKFRPEWTIPSGTPSASGSALVLNNAEVETPSTFNEGTWEFKVTKANTGAYVRMRLYLGGADKYNVIWDNTGNFFLYEVINANALILTGEANDLNEHTIKVTRNSASLWEIFFDGGSSGTATDSTTTSFDEIHLEETNGQQISIAELKVY